MTTDYESIAGTFDRRYEQYDYRGVEDAVLRFVGRPPCAVLELGSGTGHWLAVLRAHGCRVAGLDPAAAMLARARTNAPGADLVRARAEHIPFDAATFDRVLLVNALHHVTDAPRALQEAARVLRPGGAVMTCGLDPACGLDQWCIYDFFETTCARDVARFPDTRTIRAWMAAAGFDECHTELVARFQHRFPARAALAAGRLEKHTDSQLAELPDDAYRRGIAAVAGAAAEAESRGEVLHLEANLHLFATTGRLRSG